jgi:hypothetical protein
MTIDLEDVKFQLRGMSAAEGKKFIASIESNPGLKLSERMRLGDVEDDWKRSQPKASSQTKHNFLEELEAWLYVKSIKLEDLEQFYLGSVHAGIDEHGSILSKNLPKESGYYFISGYSSGRDPLTPIYIGMSDRGIKGRLNKSHHIMRSIHEKWKIDFDYDNLVVNYLIAEAGQNVALIESAFISLWDPVLNGTHHFPSREFMERNLGELLDILDFYNVQRS